MVAPTEAGVRIADQKKVSAVTFLDVFEKPIPEPLLSLVSPPCSRARVPRRSARPSATQGRAARSKKGISLDIGISVMFMRVGALVVPR